MIPLELDNVDRKILSELQKDSNQSLEEIARKVGASKTPVWNRLKKLKNAGVIKRYTVDLDAEMLGIQSCLFVLVKAAEHSVEWHQKLLEVLKSRPEVQEAHRLAGDVDYILKVRVRNAKEYDVFYQSLISNVRISNVTALLSMEDIKSGGELAL